MQPLLQSAYRFVPGAAQLLKPLFALCLCAATFVLVRHTSPAELNAGGLRHLLTSTIDDPLRHSDTRTMLQAKHLLQLATAMSAGLVVGVCAAVWQTLRRSPGACVQMTGLPIAASLGAMAGHMSSDKMSWPPLLAPVARGLPLLTSTLAALAMAALLAGVAKRRCRQSQKVFIGSSARHSARGVFAAPIVLGGLCIWLLHFLMPEQHLHVGFWLVGSFAHGHAAPWLPALACIALGVAMLSYVSGAMAQLLAGELWARHMGIDVATTKVLAYIGLSLLLAAAANLAGNILGIGLLAATLARLCVGDMPRLLWPTAGVLGAIAALWVNALVQASGDVQELPVGIICAALATFGLWVNDASFTQAGS